MSQVRRVDQCVGRPGGPEVNHTCTAEGLHEYYSEVYLDTGFAHIVHEFTLKSFKRTLHLHRKVVIY